MWNTIFDKLNQFNTSKGTVSLGFKDLMTGFDFYFQKDEVFPAASIIKIPILIELFRKVEQGKIDIHNKVILKDEDKYGGAGILTELHEGIELTIMDLAKLMIVISDNSATNILIDLIGFNSINSFMRKNGMAGILRRKMMVPYEAHEENLISSGDIILLLEKLYKGELLSPEYTTLTIDIMKRQQYNEKIPLYLPEGTVVAHKTGELDGVRHDAGIIYLPQKTYLLCILTRGLSNVLEGDRFIGEISKIIFNTYL